MDRSVRSFFAAGGLLCAVLLACSGAAHRSDPPAPAALQAAEKRAAPAAEINAAERERLLAIGKTLFLERCASCHNERGEKPLPDGPPLNERALARETIQKAVNGRFRNKSDEEKLGVVLYIESLRRK